MARGNPVATVSLPPPIEACLSGTSGNADTSVVARAGGLGRVEQAPDARVVFGLPLRPFSTPPRPVAAPRTATRPPLLTIKTRLAAVAEWDRRDRYYAGIRRNRQPNNPPVAKALTASYVVGQRLGGDEEAAFEQATGARCSAPRIDMCSFLCDDSWRFRG